MPDPDERITRLIDWVVSKGGICLCETRINKETGERGLYMKKDVADPKEIIIKIPNDLIVSPLHIRAKNFGGGHTYKEIFDLSEETFSDDYPYEPATDIPAKMVNEQA